MTTTETAMIERVLPCIACGYDLQGLGMSAACPECGEPVVRSLMASQGLKKRELVTIALRLFAVWSVLQAIHLLAYIIAAFFQYGLGRVGWVESAISLIAPVSIAAIAWFAAGPLSRMIIKRDSTAGLSRAWSFDGLFALGAALLGLWFFTTGVTQLPFLWGFAGLQYNELFFNQFWTCLSRVVVGALLLLGVRPLTRLVTWLRATGGKR